MVSLIANGVMLLLASRLLLVVVDRRRHRRSWPSLVGDETGLLLVLSVTFEFSSLGTLNTG